MKVTVLRLGHRLKRDPRLTTHVCLTARALGAQEVILSGEKDQSVLDSIKQAVKRWGGPFKIRYEPNWKKVISKFKGNKVHLTMYGLNLSKINLTKLSKKPILVIVGSEKVPSEVYTMVDLNVAVGNQPHSEVAALALFLDKLFKGKELNKNFKGMLKIKPQKAGKKLIKTSK